MWSASEERALKVARRLRTGQVDINGAPFNMFAPFGGFKQSGFGGHDKSIHAHDQYTELKTIWLDMSED